MESFLSNSNFFFGFVSSLEYSLVLLVGFQVSPEMKIQICIYYEMNNIVSLIIVHAGKLREWSSTVTVFKIQKSN